jgi:hypothetical protein
MNHIAHRANSILHKPSPIQACIDPGSSIRACIDSGLPFEHVLTRWTSAFCILFYKWFYVIASSNDVIASKMLLIWKVLIKGFHLRYYTMWFLQFQNLTSGNTIFDPGANHQGNSRSPLKTNQLSGRPSATFTPSVDPIKKYSKNKVLSVLWLDPILTLTLTPIIWCDGY